MSIEEIKQALTDAISNGVSKQDIKDLEIRFLESLEKRNEDQKDVDSLFSSFQTQMEKKLSEIQQSLPKASNDQGQEKETFGDFLVKVRHNDAGLKERTRKALAEGTGADGGFLVPDQFINEVLRVELENTVVRGNGARVINMASAIMKIPALNMTSNASGSMFGGIQAYWNGEGATKTASAPKFQQLQLEAKKLIGYVESSDELIDDSIVSLGQLLANTFAETIAFEEDVAFLTGDGINKPLGITNAGATVTVGRTTTGSVVTSDLVNMLARFYRRGGSPVWIVNQSVLPDIYKLKDENNNFILLPGSNASIANALPATIYGIPVVISEKISAKGTAGDVLLADMRYYLIGDRQRLTIDESIHARFQNDEKAWRFVQRVDGQCWLQSAITPRAGGSTISPFVKLGDFGA